MKSKRRLIKIVSSSSILVFTITPFIATGCSFTPSTTNKLVLDTTSFISVSLIESGDDVFCDLKAKYGSDSVKLDKVTFSYSDKSVLTAEWDKSKQQVKLSPLLAGTVTLTIDATDNNNHDATASVILTVNSAPVIEYLKLDTTNFKGIKLYAGAENANCLLTATFKDRAVNIDSVNFSYEKENVIAAQWDKNSQTVTITPKTEGSIVLTINATDSAGHLGTDYVALTVNKDNRILELDTSSFNNISLVENGDDVNCEIKAKYDNQTILLDTVTFEYSKDNVVNATWNKETQSVKLSPQSSDSIILTLIATDINNHQTSKKISLTVDAQAKEEQAILDISNFAGIKLVEDGEDVSCLLTAKYDETDVRLKTVEFAYSKDNIIEASWIEDTQKVKITPKAQGSVTLTLNATDVNDHTGSIDINLIVNAKPKVEVLLLDTSDFNGKELIDTGSDVVCNLKATYGEDETTLDTVTFSYSTDNIVSASWDKNAQTVTLSPLNEGQTTLTINADDGNGHSDTAEVELTVKPKPVPKTLEVNTSSFNGIDLYANGDAVDCLLTATYGQTPTTLKTVTFEYSENNILSAQWDVNTQKVTITPIAEGEVTLTLNATDNNEHSTTKSIALVVDEARTLQLDTSNLNGVEIFDGGNDVSCLLSAKYNAKAINLKEVTFNYSVDNILKAEWNQSSQNVIITPINYGEVNLTINATDVEENTASESIKLVVKYSETAKLVLDLSQINLEQTIGKNNIYSISAKYGVQNASLTTVSFSYGTEGILSASWDNLNSQVQINPIKIGTTTLTINATDSYGHSSSSTISIEVNSKVHEFINERTFSLRGYNNITHSGSFGTMLLFYHETDSSKAKNNYTYYALTNNHVTSGIHGLIDPEDQRAQTLKVAVAYQDWDDAKGESQTIGLWDDGSGTPNYYTILDSVWDNTSSTGKFKTLFTSYLQTTGTVNKKYYRDMTICKVDFGNYATSSLAKNRLKNLNDYASTHNNYLMQFDDYSDLDFESGEAKDRVFTGGYPLRTFGNQYIYDTATKFQKMVFENNKPSPYTSWIQMIHYFEEYSSKYAESTIYNAACVKQENSYLYSSDWQGPQNYDLTTRFGGGASGSLAIRTNDPDDVSTYKATGIYWGGWSSSLGYFAPYFSPFSLNFNYAITPWIPTTSIIERFMASDAFTNNTPTDDCCYNVI